MPIAGPISILITSNALKGRKAYCKLATIGASFADFVYVFAAVFGLTKFYSLYKPVIPYILLVGTLFLFYLGYKISKTKIDLEHMEDKHQLSEKIKGAHWSGFWTGFMLNFLNPTLFLGWLSSSFMVISLVSSLGFNTGGLDKSVYRNFIKINNTVADSTRKNNAISYVQPDTAQLKKDEKPSSEKKPLPEYFPLLLSASYAFFLSIGSIIWFFYLTHLLVKYRHRIKINVVTRIIRLLGLVLCLFGLFLGYKALVMLF